MVPIHQVIKERFQVVRSAVAVIDVIRVFPYVAAENRFGAMHKRIFAVWRLHDGQLAVLDRKPTPARTELGDTGLDQVFLHLGHRADVRTELLLELAGKLVAATTFLHPFPKMNMIEMLG